MSDLETYVKTYKPFAIASLMKQCESTEAHGIHIFRDTDGTVEYKVSPDVPFGHIWYEDMLANEG